MLSAIVAPAAVRRLLLLPAGLPGGVALQAGAAVAAAGRWRAAAAAAAQARQRRHADAERRRLPRRAGL